MGAKRSRSRRTEQPASGQHLLRSDALAAELVAQTGIEPEDVVLEIGAGRGRLTLVLARAAHTVIAVELDPRFVSELRRRFGKQPSIRIVNDDVLRIRFPEGPFRAFGNLPFGLSTAILRRLLDDPTSGLIGADLILQLEAARKRASTWPSNMLSLAWMPWWEFHVVRHLHASVFVPPPSVDASVLAVRRRARPLLPVEQRNEYRVFLREGFRRADLPVHRAISGSVDPEVTKRALRERGLPKTATARDLDVFDWVALYSISRGVRDR